MTVADLITMLEQQDTNATVVLWDDDAVPQPAIVRLRAVEVRPIQLGSWEANGMLILEVWDESRSFELDGPFAGIALG